MKTKSFILLFFLFTTTTYAQLEQEKKKEYKWQIAVNISTVEPASDAGFDNNALSQRIFVNGHRKDNSYCVGLNIGYKIREDCAVRISAKITNYKITETRDFREFYPQSSNYELASLDAKQSVFTISPGIFWNSNYKKLNFYGGFQLVYKQYSSIIGNTTYGDYLYANNTAVSEQKYYQEEPGGFSIGAGPLEVFL